MYTFNRLLGPFLNKMLASRFIDLYKATCSSNIKSGSANRNCLYLCAANANT